VWCFGVPPPSIIPVFGVVLFAWSISFWKSFSVSTSKSGCFFLKNVICIPKLPSVIAGQYIGILFFAACFIIEFVCFQFSPIFCISSDAVCFFCCL